MNWAEKYIGIPYVSGGRSMEGCDCWGLVMLVLGREKGISLPSYSSLISDESRNAAIASDSDNLGTRIDTPEPFAVVVMSLGRRPHVGICIDEKRMLHIDDNGIGAHVVEFGSHNFRNRINAIYRANHS